MTEPPARPALPSFIRDALEAEPAPATGGAEGGPLGSRSVREIEHSLALLEAELYDRTQVVAAGIEPKEPGLPRALSRLEASVGELPYRYAPFFSSLAELFDWPEAAVVTELTRLREPGAWKFAGLPGIAKVDVSGGPAVRSAETLFVRFNPGVYFPRHQHTGLERVLVLEGSYEDDGGVVHRPGELREWAVGTQHAFKVHAGPPCIFASVVFGRRFDAWPLRALAWLLEPRAKPR